MELLKQNIHMNQMKCRAATQFTLEDDINISDQKPDVIKVICSKGNIKIDELRPETDHVIVKGKLQFGILYRTEPEDKSLYCMEGSIPIEEQVYMDGVTAGDQVELKPMLEDLTVHLINSRKLSIQALICFEMQVEALVDSEVSVGVSQSEYVEACQKKLKMLELQIQKKDVFRIREEVELHKELPNIYEIIWKEANISSMELKPIENGIAIQGELTLFLVYEGEGDTGAERCFEKVTPIMGKIECSGCSENMIPSIAYEVGHVDTEVKQDFDGEERIIAVEAVLELFIKMYQEEEVEVLSDLYGINKVVDTGKKEVSYQNLTQYGTQRMKIEEKWQRKDSSKRIQKICHSFLSVTQDDVFTTEEGIQIEGTIAGQILYLGENGEFQAEEIKLPMEYLLEVPNMTKNHQYRIQIMPERVSITSSDQQELDIEAVLLITGFIWKGETESLVDTMEVSDLNIEQISALPSIIAYVAKAEDSLWKIGKRYYMPLDRIRELNSLASDTIKEGDKLLLVKGNVTA